MTSSINFKPKIEKIVETILYLSHKISTLDTYRVVKLIYLADREHLNRYGRPITFDEMVAMEYGPVPSNAYNILKGSSVVNGQKMEKLPFSLETIETLTYISNPSRAINRKLFSKSDLNVIDEIVEQYGNMDFRKLYHETHQHVAYRNAWASRGSSKSHTMLFEDMIDENASKQDIVSDLTAISLHI